MMKKKSEPLVFEKATQLAFLSLENCQLKPFRKPGGRVAFEVSGDVYGALARLSTNPPVPILDYINRLDAIRSVIFSMKEQTGGRYGE